MGTGSIMHEAQPEVRLFLRLLRYAHADVVRVFITGAICEVFLVIVSLVIKSTAGDDPDLKPTSIVLVKVILYAEVGTAILTILFAVALTVDYVRNRISNSSGSAAR